MPARAQTSPVLAQIRETRQVTCAAEERPGFADEDRNDTLTGLAVDLCHAVAVAVLGPDGKAMVTMPESDAEFADLVKTPPDLVFFSAGTLSDHHLATAVVVGPTVFIDPLTVMVPADAPAHGPPDLAGKTVCVMIGNPEQRAMEASLGSLTPAITRLTFREEVEMLDAYNVGRCDAMAGAASTLAGYRLTAGVNRKASRLLDTPMALVPVAAATPSADGAWASLAGSILRDLIADSAPKSAWRGDRDLSAPALRPGWREEVRKVVGGYDDMRRHSMGEASRFRLPAWPNAVWPAGLLVPMAVD